MATSDRFRHLDEQRFDVIVVGAGTGGLTAAALLAARGRKVLIVDQHYVAGGNATTFKRKGWEFDVGIHYIGGCHPGGMIPRLLRAAGVTDVEFEELDPDGYDTLVYPDFRFRVPRGIEPFRGRLLEHFPDERRGIERYVALLLQLQRLQGLLARPVAALWTLPRSLLLLRSARSTFGEFLDSCTRDPRLRAVLAGQHGDYAQPPSRAAALVGAGLALHYLEGAYCPRGGGQVMSDRLADSVERHGGKVLLRTRVRRILVENGRAAGVEIDSPHLGVRRVRAPVVISNADLKRTIGELLGPSVVSAKTMRRAAGYEMSPSMAVLYLGIRRDLRAEGHPRTNYWVYHGTDYEPGYAALARGELADKPWVYISIASVKDPTNRRAAPAGMTNLQVMTLAPARPETWGVTEAEVESGAYRDSPAYQAKKAQVAASLVESARAIFPDLGETIAYQELSTPLSHRRYTLSSGGTSYGIALTPQQFLGGRPAARTEIDGLYLCGASCRTGHGIAGVMMSGLMAAAAVSGVRLVQEVFAAPIPVETRRPDGERSQGELEVA